MMRERVDPFHSTGNPITCNPEADLPIWCAGSYRGTLQRVILHWKSHRSHQLTEIITERFGQAVREWAPQWPHHGRVGGGQGNWLWLVPVPSSNRRIRADLFVVADLTRAAAHALSQFGPVGILDPLRYDDPSRRRGPGGRHSTAQHRRARRHISMRTELPPLRVLLIDDVATTGSTLRLSAEVLRQGGAQVLGALALADVHVGAGSGETPLRQGAKTARVD